MVLDDCGGTGTTNLACIRLGIGGPCVERCVPLNQDSTNRGRHYFDLLTQLGLYPSPSEPPQDPIPSKRPTTKEKRLGLIIWCVVSSTFHIGLYWPLARLEVVEPPSYGVVGSCPFPMRTLQEECELFQLEQRQCAQYDIGQEVIAARGHSGQGFRTGGRCMCLLGHL